MSGLRSDYAVGSAGDHFTIQDSVAGRDGLDSLYGVERIRFSDGEILDLTATSAPAAIPVALLEVSDAPPRPIEEVFLTVPDPGAAWTDF